ncbi:O-antigen ligase family protein [Lautropia mirabilis]|uniref:O-antigen ligase family protein n=1 Tax=Lautropia mirabilis TaxID=47671 RepID=UPI00391F5C45
MLLVNVAHGLLALYLLTLLAVPKVQTPLVALTCLLAIIGGQWLKAPPLGRRLREGWAMAVPLVGYATLFAVQIEMGWLRWRDWDQVLICALGLGVLLSNLPARGPAVHRWLLPAAALGAVGALGLASWQYFQLGIPRPHGHLGAGVVGSGALKYGDLSAVLALFSLQLVLRGPQVWRRVLGGVGFMAGLGAVALTQARGALLGVALALVVLGLLWWLRRRAQSSAGQAVDAGRHGRERHRPWWRQRQPVLAALLGVVVLFGATDYMGARFADIGPQYERFQAGDNNSEVGQRLALWGIALRAARHAPFTGVGFDGFGAETQRQRDTGELARDALVLYQGPHNEYLAGLSAAGIPGLIVIVLFFWAPLVVGCRRFLRGQQTETALMLVLFTASYAAFTMTDSLLDRQISLLAYVLLASWLMSASGPAAAANAASPSGIASPDSVGPDGGERASRSMQQGDVSGSSSASAAGVQAPAAASSAAVSAGTVTTADGLSVPGGLSVAIIACNEAHRIARCLQSVSFADQIVVLDSGSTDDTVTIARRLGADVEVTPDWPGFGPQKNRALARCRYRWVLSIDADEQVSDALAAEILRVLREAPAEATVAGYWLRRSSRYCGQVIRHGLWGNDRVLRLFERQRGRFTDARVHESLVCDGETRVLEGILVHDSVDSPEDARSKARRYAFLGAEALRARGRGGALQGGVHAGWSFVRGYLLRAGFLDGRFGLTLARLNAAGTFWKYHWAALPEAKWEQLRASLSASEPNASFVPNARSSP